MRRHAATLALVLVALAFGSAPPAGADETRDPPAAVLLPIPARSQAPESPPSGWCGETAIQEGLLHLGVWAPQRVINAAGRPSHPDLYSPEIPVALSALGVRHTFYAGARGYEPFAKWVRAAIDEGVPVFAGVKLLPTQHPEWGLDHFVLAVGHGPKGLLVNTTWGSQKWIDGTATTGISLEKAFFGIRMTGLALPERATAARLTVLEETSASVKLRVSCTGVKRDGVYRFEQRSVSGQGKPTWSETTTARTDRIEEELTLPAAQTARFLCIDVAR